MGKKFKQVICIFTSMLLTSSFTFNHIIYAEGNPDQHIMNEVLSVDDDAVYNDTDDSDENWLLVALEVLDYYSMNAAGLEVSVTEADKNFYDVVDDNVINISDATYFLNIYSVLAAGLEFDGYIPVRDQHTTETTTSTTSTIDVTTTTVDTSTSDLTSTSIIGETTMANSIDTSETTVSTVTTTLPTITSKETTTKLTTTVSVNQTTSSITTSTYESTTETAETTTTVVTRPPLEYGIDVSVYQGAVDWKAVRESGVDFAIIRAGYGKHINQKDRYFDVNMESAQKEGLKCGAYWFSYAITPEDAEKEADVFYEVIKDYKFEYPVFFDYETNEQYALTPKENSEIIKAFCERMQSYGYYVSLCSYVGFLNYRIENEIFDIYDTWIAHYDVAVPWYSRDYGIWQYSCTGKVDGIDTNVDLNYSYRDYMDIMKNNHLNVF